MAETNAEIARAIIEGVWSGNLDAAHEHPGYWPGLHTFDYVRSAFPDLKADIKQQVVEGDKERIQVYQGVLIAQRGRGINTMITVRRIVANEGVERIFPLHSPRIAKVEVKRT